MIHTVAHHKCRSTLNVIQCQPVTKLILVPHYILNVLLFSVIHNFVYYSDVML